MSVPFGKPFCTTLIRRKKCYSSTNNKAYERQYAQVQAGSIQGEKKGTREGKAEGGTKERRGKAEGGERKGEEREGRARREKRRREFVLQLLPIAELTKDSRLCNATPSVRYPGSIQGVFRKHRGSKNFHPA